MIPTLQMRKQRFGEVVKTYMPGTCIRNIPGFRYPLTLHGDGYSHHLHFIDVETEAWLRDRRGPAGAL